MRYADIEKDIIARIKSKNCLDPSWNYTLLGGFTRPRVYKDCCESFNPIAPTVPCVVLIDNDSGEIIQFALGALMPEIDLNEGKFKKEIKKENGENYLKRLSLWQKFKSIFSGSKKIDEAK